ncbi:MAG: ParB N-terminal domain-containing protein, partial [Candidatus Hodarchaeota archaeon]
MEREFREVYLDGIPTKVLFRNVLTSKLILDENNPRIQFYRDNRIEQRLSQEEIYYALVDKKPDAFQRLYLSIEKNQGLMNPIWIQETDSEKYLVLEGNTRTLIYRKLQEKYPNSKIWEGIDCFILPKDLKEEQKNFIKLEAHLGGTEEWDAYEKARELYRLNEEAGYPIDHLADLTRQPKLEITKAIKAFKVMRNLYLPNYGDEPSQVHKYSYFEQYFN